MSDSPSKPWFLVDIEERAREHAGSYHIPSRRERLALQPGQLAKLVFEQDGIGFGCTGERMWVKITKRDEAPLRGRIGEWPPPPWYTGELDNEPAVISGLKLGDKICFLAENIVEWMP